MAKIIFIPFTDAEGNHSERYTANSWIAKMPGYSLVVFDGSKQAGLQTAGCFDDVYIFGHGGAGVPYIQNDRYNTMLQSDVVADRLCQSGIGKAFAGSVKVYACHSAESAPGQSSFAKRFARELIAVRGRFLVSVHGYSGLLTPDVYTDQVIGRQPDQDFIETPHSKAHKWSKSYVNQPNEHWTKAKNTRERFSGFL